MEHSANERNQASVEADEWSEATATDQAPIQTTDAAEWRRTVTEVLADADGPLTLHEIRQRAGEALGAPAPPALQEQMESLLGLGHIERADNDSVYAITERGRWLVEGNRVLHG